MKKLILMMLLLIVASCQKSELDNYDEECTCEITWDGDRYVVPNTPEYNAYAQQITDNQQGEWRVAFLFIYIYPTDYTYQWENNKVCNRVDLIRDADDFVLDVTITFEHATTKELISEDAKEYLSLEELSAFDFINIDEVVAIFELEEECILIKTN